MRPLFRWSKMTDHHVHIPDKRIGGWRGGLIACPFLAETTLPRPGCITSAETACTRTGFTDTLPQSARGHLSFEKPCTHLNVEGKGDRYWGITHSLSHSLPLGLGTFPIWGEWARRCRCWALLLPSSGEPLRTFLDSLEQLHQSSNLNSSTQPGYC